MLYYPQHSFEIFSDYLLQIDVIVPLKQEKQSLTSVI